jgi:uncharacterized protein (UPF0333 family)
MNGAEYISAPYCICRVFSMNNRIKLLFLTLLIISGITSHVAVQAMQESEVVTSEYTPEQQKVSESNANWKEKAMMLLMLAAGAGIVWKLVTCADCRPSYITTVIYEDGSMVTVYGSGKVIKEFLPSLIIYT